MSERHLYYQEVFNDWEYSEDEWAETNNVTFADKSDFDSETVSLLLLVGLMYLVRVNTSKQFE